MLKTNNKIYRSILVFKLTDFWGGSYEIWNMSRETCDPIISWIALGMKESGNYLDNADYATYPFFSYTEHNPIWELFSPSERFYRFNDCE